MLEGVVVMSVQTLNPLFLVSGNAFRKRTQCKARPNSNTSLHSSVVPFTDRSGNSWEHPPPGSGTCLLTQPNTIGVIGGVSVLSTLIFLEKLACWSSRNGRDCPPFVVCSDPVLGKALPLQPHHLRSVKNRADHIRLNKDMVMENLRRKRNLLRQSGARCFVMPCHLSHAWYCEVSEDGSLPFLHVGECIALELKNSKLKPIHAANSVRIGLLTTDSVLVASYYQEKLQNQGFEVVLLDKETEEHTMVLAVEALNRKDIEGTRNLLRIAIHVLLMRAVNMVILASDDLVGVLPHNDPLLRKCIDPMDALARSTIQWAETAEKVH